MAKVMYVLNALREEPDFETIKKNLNLQDDDIDQDFGVQIVDSVAGDYCILIEEKVLEKIDSGYKA